ncbi:hypothetical protein LCGC14_2137090, partial [marine sediment metagenome]
MQYPDIGNPKHQLGQCVEDTTDEYGVFDKGICYLVLWVYSRSLKLEVRKGYTHSRLHEGEEPWKGTKDELARGKFDFDMKLGSIAFVLDDIIIQRVIANELKARFKESVF